MTSAASSSHGMTSADSTVDTAKAKLSQGVVFTGYFENRAKGTAIKHALLVFYRETPNAPSTELGCLFWCLPAKRVESPDRCLQLSQISDLYLGKHTHVFKLAIAADAPADRCFSIVCKDKTHLNFEAESAEQLQAWLSALNVVITSAGRKRVVEPDPPPPTVPARLSVSAASGSAAKTPAEHKSAAASNGSAQSSNAPSSAAASANGFATPVKRAGGEAQHQDASFSSAGSSSLSSVSIPQSLEQGAVFVAYFAGNARSKGQPVRQEVQVYCEDSAPAGASSSGAGLPTIYWCLPSKRSKIPACALQLDHIAKVFLGKQTSVFSMPFAASAAPELCFSLVGRDGTQLNLEARSPEQLEDWLRALTAMLNSAPVVQAKAAAAAFSPPASPHGQQQQSANGAGRTTPPQTARLVQRSSQSPSASPALTAMIPSSSPGIAAATGGNASVSSFSLNGGSHPPSPRFNDRNGNGNGNRDSKHPSPVATPPRKESLAESMADLLLTSPEEAMRMSSNKFVLPSFPYEDTVRMMEQGSIFTGYFEHRSKGTVVKQDLLVFYRKTESDLNPGTLFWCLPNAPRVRSPGCRMALAQIADVYLGKQTRAFKHATAAAAQPDRCFTIVCKDRTHLNFEAQSPEVLAAWLFGINNVLTNYGRKIIPYDRRKEAEDATAAMAAAHAASSLEDAKYVSDGTGSGDNSRRSSGNVSSVDAEAAAYASFTAQFTGGAGAYGHNGQQQQQQQQHGTNSYLQPFGTLVAAALPRSDVKENGVDLTSVISEDNPASLFEFIAKIGDGSYGSVYKALDRRDNTLVAVKVIQSEGSVTQLTAEINMLKKCTSPFVVSYKGTFVLGFDVWIVMEYCGGGSLCDLMAICEFTLEEQQIAAIMKMALQGLEYLHAERVIHRDVKAGNLLLTTNGVCKLADFGVAAQLTSTMPKRRTVIGSPYWMAPEVVASESEYNEKADIWSLAITAMELALGDPPNSDVPPMRAIFVIHTRPTPTLPKPERWSKNFHDFLAVCLVKNPDQRPSASQLLKHPFITNAGGTSVVASLVSNSMAQIEHYRALESRLEQSQAQVNTSVNTSAAKKASSGSESGSEGQDPLGVESSPMYRARQAANKRKTRSLERKDVQVLSSSSSSSSSTTATATATSPVVDASSSNSKSSSNSPGVAQALVSAAKSQFAQAQPNQPRLPPLALGKLSRG